jgi:tRNA(Arg) A34 adenosine deaminase TadA
MNRRYAAIRALGIVLVWSCLLLPSPVAADNNSGPPIKDKSGFYAFAKMLPLHISEKDGYPEVLRKIGRYLDNFQPESREEEYSLEATKQALAGCRTGGYGIGAVLVDPQGNIVERAYNEMRQQARSDLHGEMTLLTKFETKRTSPVRRGFQLPPGYKVVSSAEPCPMCMIRLASAGVKTLYVARNDKDSLSQQPDRLPGFWRDLCKKHPCRPAQVSEDLSRVAYLLFYTIVFMDDRQDSPWK